MISLTVGGINVTKYLVQESYSAPISEVKDSENCFTAADGTVHEPVLGFSQTLDFVLARLDDDLLSSLFNQLYKPKVAVSMNVPISRKADFCCVSASPVALRSAGSNLWQVQISMRCLELLRDSDSL